MIDSKFDKTKIVPRLFFLGYSAFIVVLSVAILYAGPVSQVWYGHDLFCLMDGGWKILHGSRPHLDFYTLLGPLTHLIMALGMALTGPSPYAFPLSIVLTLIPLAFICWWQFSERMKPLICFLTCSYICLVWVAPFPLHFDFWQTCYALIYNRQSYALLCILAVILLMPSQRCLEKGERNDGFAVGLLLALIFFFKITFFVAALVLLLPLLPVIRPTRQEIVKAVLGFLLVTIPMMIYLGGINGARAMFSTYSAAAKVRDPQVIISGLVLLFLELRGLIPTLVAVQCLVWLNWKLEAPGKIKTTHLPVNFLYIESAAVIAASAFAEMGACPNSLIFDVPLLGVYNVILLDRFLSIRRSRLALDNRLVSYIGIYCCVLIFVALFYVPLLGIASIVNERMSAKNYAPDTIIDSPAFQDMPFISNRGTGQYPAGVTYVKKINDGLKLIRKHPELSHALIASLDVSDSFSIPLQRPSPPCTPWAWTYGTTFDENTHPSAEHIFLKCDVLMIPKIYDYDARTTPCLLAIYKDYLKNNFSQLDQSQFWFLLVKK